MDALSPVDHFHARGYQATVELGDCLPIADQQLPYEDGTHDGAYTQHVTMNVVDPGAVAALFGC